MAPHSSTLPYTPPTVFSRSGLDDRTPASRAGPRTCRGPGADRVIDLHTHCLPGIDDGAASWDEAIEMCRRAADDGCRVVVATPHQRRAWPNDDALYLAGLVEEARQRIGPVPELLLGGEIHVDSRLLDDLDRDDLAGMCPLAGSRWLLLEFGLMETARGAERLIRELRLGGWRPLIAHPELIPFLADDLGLLERLVRLGARSQLTAMSVTGDFGRRARDAAQRMLDAGLAHVVASDTHSPEWRPPGLSRARRELERRWGADLATRLVEGNPRCVLEDADMPSAQLA